MAQLARLRELRERESFSMRALSARSGVSVNAIWRAEQGEMTYPSTTRKLAKALGVTPAELRGDAVDVTAPSAPEPPALAPIGERQAILVANMLDQAERARERGDDAGAAQFEQMAAHAAAAAAATEA